MKTILPLLCLLALGGGTLAAQEAPPSPKEKLPPLPPAPILHRAPDLAQWTMSFDVAPTAAAMPTVVSSPARGRDSAAKTFPHKITVIKSGRIFLEVEMDTEGKRWEKWNTGGQQVSLLSGSDKWLLSNGGDPGMFYTDYTRADFPDLLWIGAKNYVAFTKLGGSDCFIFHDNIVLPGGRDPVEVTAALDSATLWPVYLDVGGWKRTYQFEQPPQAPLTVPENVQAIFTQQAKALAPLLRRPGQS